MAASDLDEILNNNTFDTRELIEYLADLESTPEDERDQDWIDEYDRVTEFADVLQDSAADYEYGETVIADHYFEDYARELAEDLGSLPREYSWPTSCIDWEQAARELQQDYTAVEFEGQTWWTR